MKTYVFSCQKGGVAKTTSSHTLAVGLSNRGYKVLGLDLDSQCNFTQSVGLDALGDSPTIYNVLRGEVSARDAAQQIKPNFYAISGALELANADMEFVKTGRESLLKRALRSVKDDFDFCVIDTSPHLGIMTTNALTAADSVIIPITADEYCLQGLLQLKGAINSVREFCNDSLNVEGILITRYSPRTNATKALMQTMDYYAKELQTKVFETRIREAVAIRETQIIQSDLFTDFEKADVTQDYAHFIDELLGSEVEK